MTGAELLRQYLQAKGKPEDIADVEIEHFGSTPEMAEELLGLILSGAKRATCWACISSEQPPEPGRLSVVTHWDGEAGCVLETVRAQTLPFSGVPWELARKEGEDTCMESWKRNHEAFFRAEAAQGEYEYSENMPVIFEEFRVVWPEEYADRG